MGQCYNHLSLTEREEISRAIALGRSPADIARDLGRCRSTIGRELKRHSSCPHAYRAAPAQRRAQRNACRPRRRRKLRERWLARYVQRALLCGWSPEQIAARLKRDYPQDMGKRISHETIYAAIYIIPRGELRRAFLTCLRQHRKRRRPRSRGADRRGQIPNRTAIALRPPEVASRLVPGHWEGDLLKGKANGSAVGTLVERTTRLVVLARMDGLDSESVCRGFERKLRPVPQVLRKSLTYDQGREMARHERLRQKLSLHTYFADPHSPWQRGSNENTNGLLRQYLPRNTNLALLTQRQLNAVAKLLNDRPRKTLHWMTPNEAWAAQLQSLPVALGT